MERLTIKTPQGPALKMSDTYPSEEAAREDLMRLFCIAVIRLSAYEDAMPLERAQEFAQAEKDGWPWNLSVLLKGRTTRLIDADALEEILQTALRDNPHQDGFARVCHRSEYTHFLDVIRRMPVITPPPNDPLTLEQLREMEGEPVYCISDYEMTVNGEKGYRPHAEGWGIVTGTDLGDQGFISGTTRTYYLAHYGKTWLAYRRRPEEVNNEQ